MKEYPAVKKLLTDYANQIDTLRAAIIDEIPVTDSNQALFVQVNKFFDCYKFLQACFAEYVYGFVSGYE